MNNTAFFLENLPLFIPLIVLELILMFAAIRSVLTQQHFRLFNRNVWLVIVVVFQLIGPIVYFVIGREEA